MIYPKIYHPLFFFSQKRLVTASQVAELVKNPPVSAGDSRDMGTTRVGKIPWSRIPLGWEDLLE